MIRSLRHETPITHRGRRSSAFSSPARKPRASLGPGLVALCLAVLVAQIDTAVVNLAMCRIGDELDASTGALQRVLDSYNLIYEVLLLTGGLLADLYGRRRIFVVGAGLFTVASVVRAAAPSVQILIGGCALAGLGAALLMPASLAITRVLWCDSNQWSRALGIWAACNGLAMVMGPTLGGMLIVSLGWRGIFLIAIPFSVAAPVVAYASIPETSDPFIARMAEQRPIQRG